MNTYILDWYNEQAKHTYESIQIHASNDMEAAWQAYMFIQGNSPHTNTFLMSKKDSHKYRLDGMPNPTTMWSGCYYMYPFSLEELEDLSNMTNSLSFTQVDIEKAINFLESTGESIVYAIDRCVFTRFWNNNFLDIGITEYHSSNLMALFRLAETMRHQHVKNVRAVKMCYTYTTHLVIRPIDCLSSFDDENIALISNAFRMWQNQNVIDNMVCESTDCLHLVYTFDINSDLLLIKNMNIWLERHGVKCCMEGIATTVFYDYIEFSIQEDITEGFKLTHFSAVGHAELLERNLSNTLLDDTLHLYYDSER